MDESDRFTRQCAARYLINMIEVALMEDAPRFAESDPEGFEREMAEDLDEILGQ